MSDWFTRFQNTFGPDWWVNTPVGRDWWVGANASDGPGEYIVEVWITGQPAVGLALTANSTSSGATQWYADDVAIPGATESTYIPVVGNVGAGISVSVGGDVSPKTDAVVAIDYHVSTTGNDTTGDGSIGAPWRTIGHAITTTQGTSRGILVETGNYYTETSRTVNALAGTTLTFVADGEVNVRMNSAASDPYSQLWLFQVAAGGGLTFRGFNFNIGLTGADAANARNLIGGAAAGGNHKFIFHDCTFVGGSAVVGGNGCTWLEMYRCKIDTFSSYFARIVGGTLKMESCYVANVASATWMQGNMTLVDVRHCTWNDAQLTQFSSVTYGTVNMLNNLCVRSSSAVVMQLGVAGGADEITTLNCDGNGVYKTNMPSPRTELSYYAFNMVGKAGYYDNSIWVQPSFTTAPALGSDSFAIGRGVTGTSVLRDIEGKAFSTTTPNIGCYHLVGGAAKTITPTADKIEMVGDSFTFGSGASAATRYVTLIENSLTDKTFVKMPGGNPGDMLGIFGCTWSTISKMAMEFAQAESPQLVTMLGAVNDISDGGNNTLAATVIDAIKRTLDTLEGMGVKTLYCGTQVQSDVLTAESRGVEDAVAAYCDIKGYNYVLTSELLIAEPGWYDGVGGTDLISPDGLHPNVAGHAKYAEWIEPAIVAAVESPYGILVDNDNPPLNLGLPLLTQAFLAQDNVYLMTEDTTAPNTTWFDTDLPAGDFTYIDGSPTKTYSGTISNTGFGIDFSRPASGYVNISGTLTINSGSFSAGSIRFRTYSAANGFGAGDSNVWIGRNDSGSFTNVKVLIPAGTEKLYFYCYSADVSFTLSDYSAFECDASGVTIGTDDLLPSSLLTAYPDEVYDPLNQTPPIEHILFAPGNYRGRISNTLYGNLGYLAPRSGGTVSNPVHFIALPDLDLADPDLSYDLNETPGPWDRKSSQQVLLDSVYCVGSTAYAYGANESDYMRFIGFDVGGRDKGSQFYGHATGCVFKRMRFKNIGISAVVQPIKFAQAGSDYTIDTSPKGNTVSECLIERYPPFTDQDCIGIQVEKYAINNTIEYCTILNYTDAVQTLYRSNDDQGLCEGLKISNCFSGFTSEVRTNGDAENILGCEQSGWDFKVGGVDGNPVICIGNTIFGGRPNSSSIGDAISPHFCAAYLTFEGNKFVDNECVATLNVCYGPAVTITGGGGTGAEANAVVIGGEVVAVNMAAGALGTGYTSVPTISFPGPGTGATATATINGTGQVTGITVTNGGSGYVMYPPNTVFNNNLFSGIKSHGSGIWAGREGQIRQLSNTATFTNNQIVDCDEWADRDTGTTEELVEASVTTGNTVYGSLSFGFQFANQAAWESEGNAVVSDTSTEITVGIPFTRKTLTYKAV